MTIKIQRNPSTGKILYDSATQKVIAYDTLGESCEHCTGDTPKRIRLVFEGTVGCEWCGVLYQQGGIITTGTIDGAYIVTQDPWYDCWWTRESIAGDYGDYTKYVDGCGSEIHQYYEWVYLSIRVIRYETSLRVGAYVHNAAKTVSKQSFYNNVATSADCILESIDNHDVCSHAGYGQAHGHGSVMVTSLW